jgi:hypothetical protein
LGERETERHRETQRDTERHRETQRDTERHRETQRDTERHREIKRDKERERWFGLKRRKDTRRGAAEPQRQVTRTYLTAANFLPEPAEGLADVGDAVLRVLFVTWCVPSR